MLVIPKKAQSSASYESSVSHPSPTEFSILNKNMFIHTEPSLLSCKHEIKEIFAVLYSKAFTVGH